MRGDAAVKGYEPVAVRVLVRPEHRHYAARFLAGGIEAIATIDRAFGGFGDRSVVLADSDWRVGADGEPPGAVSVAPVRWWTTETAMAPELAASRAVSRRFWTGVLKTDRLPVWFSQAFAELTARRATAAVFGRDNLSPGYAFTEARYFGGFLPRFVRIRVKVETDGALNAAYRAQPHVDMTIAPRSEAEGAAQIGKAILAFTTLERWVGQPVADDIMRRFTAALRERDLRLADFEQLASAISAQDLSWLFDSAFRSTGVFDYAITRIESVRDGDGYLSTVTVRRNGDARFTGRSGERDGPFERGRGVTVQSTFADGQRRSDAWDGRDEETTFSYRSPTPIADAIVDPDGVMLLDVWRTRNSAAIRPHGRSAATEWAARYAVWLQTLLLTYGALV